MSSEKEQEKMAPWTSAMEKFEKIIVATLALLLAMITTIILAVVAYLFVTKIGTFVTSADTIADVKQAALNGFSGILLVLLGLELLKTVKIYSREYHMRVEVILLVGLIAMGRHVLEIDLHHIEPLILFGFAGLLLAIAISYFIVKRAQFSSIRPGKQGSEERDEISTGK